MDGNTNRNSVCEGMDRPGVHIQNIRFGTVAAAYPGALAPPIATRGCLDLPCGAGAAQEPAGVLDFLAFGGREGVERLAHLVGGASEGVDHGGDTDVT
ncbi:MAG TPA: hypothetical protein VGG54_00980 [Trebonia sp.]|jgi:hypothetical protein